MGWFRNSMNRSGIDAQPLDTTPTVSPDPMASQYVYGGSTGTSDGSSWFGNAMESAGLPAPASVGQIADENAAATSTDLGALQNSADAYGRSAVRYDQTNKERTAEQQQNYQYGGYAGGAEDAIGTARGNLDPYTQSLGAMGSAIYNEAATGAAGYGTGMGGLYGTADALTQYAQQGPGASVAQAQLDANTAMAMRQQLALAGSGRGAGGGASAFRNAAANQAQIQGQANANSAMLQAQEAQNWRQAQLAAYGAAGGMYGQGAGLGSEYAQGMAGLGIDATNAAGSLQAGTEGLTHQINMGALGGDMGYEQNLTSIYGIDKGVPKTADPNAFTWRDAAGLGLQTAGVVGGFMAGGPAGAAAGGVAGTAGADAVGGKTSDIRAKTNIEPASALDAVSDAGGYSYNYLNPERHGEGTYVGPMAQDLERAPGVVYEQPDGTKAIDPGRLTAVNTSAIAELNAKVDALAGNDSPSGYNPYDDMQVRAEPKKAKAKARPKVEIGEAVIESRGIPDSGYGDEYTDAEMGRAGPSRYIEDIPEWELAREQGGSYYVEDVPMDQRLREVGIRGIDIGPAVIERPATAAVPATGPTQPIAFTGDPGTVSYLQDKYKMPIYGAPAPSPAEESNQSFLDAVFGPSLGTYVDDVAYGTKADEELKQYWRSPPRVDTVL